MFSVLKDIVHNPGTTNSSTDTTASLYAIFSALEEGFIFLDQNLYITYFNNAAYKILNKNYHLSCKIGMHAVDSVPQYRSGDLLQTLTDVLHGNTKQYECAISQDNGTTGWVTARYLPMKDVEETVTGICIVLKDVSAQKELELAETKTKTIEKNLYESRMQFEAFMENAPIIAWINTSDGAITYMNETYRKTFGFTKEDAGKKICEIFPTELAVAYYESNLNVIKTGKPVEVIEKTVRADGSSCINRIFKFPISLNGTTLIAGWGIDITEQMRLQQELSESNERYHYVNKATSDAIYDWDLTNKKIYRGKGFKKLFGYTKDVVSVRYWLANIHPGDMGQTRKIVFEALRDPKQDKISVEYRIRCNDGLYKYVMDKAFIIRDAQKAIRVIGAIRDITAEKELDKKILLQEKAKKREIVRSIIETQEKERRQISIELHDNVNQILSSCKLMLEVAKDNKENALSLTEKSHQSLQVAIAEIRRICHGLNPSAIEDIGLEEAVEEMVEKINLSQKLKVGFTINKDDFKVGLKEEDKVAIYRIIQEQLTNIVKHSGATQAFIHLVVSSSKVQLTIEDNGIGFNEKTIKKGLGLRSIYHRVEYYHGIAELTTRCNQGCKLYIELQLNPECKNHMVCK